MNSKPKRHMHSKKDHPVIKTTVHLPEDLWRKAKILGVEQRRGLRDLIIEGLNLVLKKKTKEK